MCMFASKQEGAVVANLRKEADARAMADAMAAETLDAVRENISDAPRTPTTTPHRCACRVSGGRMNCLDQTIGENFALYHGDCVEVIKGAARRERALLDLLAPFASLYTYSNSPRDMGNCRSNEEFFRALRLPRG